MNLYILDSWERDVVVNESESERVYGNGLDGFSVCVFNAKNNVFTCFGLIIVNGCYSDAIVCLLCGELNVGLIV